MLTEAGSFFLFRFFIFLLCQMINKTFSLVKFGTGKVFKNGEKIDDGFGSCAIAADGDDWYVLTETGSLPHQIADRVTVFISPHSHFR